MTDRASLLAQKAYRRVCTILAEEAGLRYVGDDYLIVQVWGIALSRAFANFASNLRRFAAPNVPLPGFTTDLLEEFRPMVRVIVDRSGGILEWHGHGLSPNYRFQFVEAADDVRRLQRDLANGLQDRIMKVLGQEMLEELVSLGNDELRVKVWLLTLGSAFAQVIIITKHGSEHVDLGMLTDAMLSDFETRVKLDVDELGGTR